MALGSALLPIPSEIVLPFTGFLTSQGTLIFPLALLFALLGDLTGSLLGYWVGYILEENVIVGLIRKYGKFALINEEDYKKAQAWFMKYGAKVVFIGKMLPGFRYFTSIPAGALKMNIFKFILYAFWGSLVWCSGLLYIGYSLGNHWKDIGVYTHKFELGIGVLFIIAVLFYINHKLKLFSFFQKK